MNETAERTVPSTRNVLHVVIAPANDTVAKSALRALRASDHQHWYPVLVLTDAHDPVASELAFDARTIGVPVVSPRHNPGTSRRGLVDSFLDQWFYAREARPSVIHVHRSRTVAIPSATSWMLRMMSRVPFITTEYWADRPSGTAWARTTSGHLMHPVESTVDSLLLDDGLTRMYAQACEHPARRSGRI